MEGLPIDVRHLIFGMCSVPDLLRFTAVSKRWRAELRANAAWTAHVAHVLYEFPEMHVFFDAFRAKPKNALDTWNRIGERPGKKRKTKPLGVTPRGYWWVFANVLACPEFYWTNVYTYTKVYNGDKKMCAFAKTLIRCLFPKQRKLIREINTVYTPRHLASRNTSSHHVRMEIICNITTDTRELLSYKANFDNDRAAFYLNSAMEFTTIGANVPTPLQLGFGCKHFYVALHVLRTFIHNGRFELHAWPYQLLNKEYLNDYATQVNAL